MIRLQQGFAANGMGVNNQPGGIRPMSQMGHFRPERDRQQVPQCSLCPPKAEVKSGILTGGCGTADEALRGDGRGITGIADTVSCPSVRAAPSA